MTIEKNRLKGACRVKLFRQNKQNKQQKTSIPSPDASHRPSNAADDVNNGAAPRSLSNDLDQNLDLIKQQFGNSPDLVIRKLQHGTSHPLQVSYLYFEGLVDMRSVLDLIDGLTEQFQRLQGKLDLSTGWPEFLCITGGNSMKVTDFQALNDALLIGATVLLINGLGEGRAIATIGGAQRAVSEPVSQTVIRGSQEAFNERLHTNIALIRRRIKDPNLWLETRELGKKTKTSIGVMYLKGLVKESIVQEINQRLDKVNIDSILEGAYLEELIHKKKPYLFPTIVSTERPDVTVAALLEGRVAILVDGTPFVLLAPALFLHFFQSPEDYYTNSFGVFRMLRFFAFFVTLFAPSLYIAITTFHQEMIPTTLLISLAAQREGLPFPALLEALIMEITMELLREGGVRMPRAIGTSISIVGAIVLGEAAVQAGLVSPAMVIVVSLTAISSFLFPVFEIGIPTRLLRFFMMIVAAVFGLFGIFVGALALVLHLCSIRSFGIPYMSPIAPLILSDQKDTLIRVPWWRMNKRPALFVEEDETRERGSGGTTP